MKKLLLSTLLGMGIAAHGLITSRPAPTTPFIVILTGDQSHAPNCVTADWPVLPVGYTNPAKAFFESSTDLNQWTRYSIPYPTNLSQARWNSNINQYVYKLMLISPMTNSSEFYRAGISTQ